MTRRPPIPEPEDYQAGLITLFITMAESLESTLDPDSRRAFLDGMHRQAHDPLVAATLSESERDAFQRLYGSFRSILALVYGGEID